MILQEERIHPLVLIKNKKITFLLLNQIGCNFVKKMTVYNLINRVLRIKKEILVKWKWL